MNTTKIIFLRHADTQKNPSINAVLWGLSEKGKKQAEEVSKLPIMNTVDIIYVSEEQKTSLTIKLLSKKLGKKIYPLYFFNEVKRGDKFLAKEDFEAEKVKQLTDLSYHAFNGESGKEALNRFKKGVIQAIEQNKEKTILIVTHGTVLNIYFAYLLKIYSQLLKRWKNTTFCAYGVVENMVVIKDIAK